MDRGDANVGALDAALEQAPEVLNAVRVEGRKMVSLATAAEMLEVDTVSVRRWISRGHITGYRIGPRMIRIDVDEMLAFVRGGAIPAVRANRDTP